MNNNDNTPICVIVHPDEETTSLGTSLSDSVKKYSRRLQRFLSFKYRFAKVIVHIDAHIYFQLRPLQSCAFAGAVREAHALDWYRRHKRPLCRDWQGKETVPGSYRYAHKAWRGGAAHSC